MSAEITSARPTPDRRHHRGCAVSVAARVRAVAAMTKTLSTDTVPRMFMRYTLSRTAPRETPSADVETVQAEFEAYVEPTGAEVYPAADAEFDAADYFTRFHVHGYAPDHVALVEGFM